MNTAKRDRIILSVLIIIIIAAIMYYVSIRPCISEVKDLNAKIDTVSAEVEGLKNKQRYIKELQTQLADIEAKVKEQEGNMSDFGDCALYLSDFQDITKNATATKILFSDITASTSGYYSIVRASVSFVCEYDDLKDIMSALSENNVHCYDVKIIADYAELGKITQTERPDSELSVSFTADYVSKSGLYTPIDYDFLSGRYGLSELFEGAVYGDQLSNIIEGITGNTGADEPVEE